MWANAQRDGSRLFNAAVWLTPTSRVPCSTAAKTRNPLKLSGVLQPNEMISPLVRRSSTYYKKAYGGHIPAMKVFSNCRYMP